MDTMFPNAFLISLALFALGALGSVLFSRSRSLALWWANCCAVLGSLFGILAGGRHILTNEGVLAYFRPTQLPQLELSISIDQLAAFFVVVISVIAFVCSLYALGYMKHVANTHSVGAFGFFYNLFIAGMLLVVTANHGLFFLIVWEVMSLASYFLIIFEREKSENVQSGFLYLIMTHIGTACILLAFLMLYKYTGSFDFNEWRSVSGTIPSVAQSGVFLLALLGFGVKAGMMPLHAWLPLAHPAAPSHVSALMSGVMIKTGIYMMIRLFFDVLTHQPLWWGIVVLLLGATSSLLGVLYALSEHDLKRLLAYHSIENIGIILMGIGGALIFVSAGMPKLMLLSLAAGLYHTVNHAVFKALLFLSAGSVVAQTHTRNIEEYGGLIKTMPYTAVFFLIGATAISGLPPLNGFVSEWLTYQALFAGVQSFDILTKGAFIIAIGSLAFTGGLAAACFVKAFGATFLAQPRSTEAAHAKESSHVLRVGMGILAFACILLGVGAARGTAITTQVAQAVTGATGASAAHVAEQTVTVQKGFAVLTMPTVFAALLAALALVYLIWYIKTRKRNVVVRDVWDCGRDVSPQNEITATAFSRSLLTIFRGLLQPVVTKTFTAQEKTTKYFGTIQVESGLSDIYGTYFYNPLHHAVLFFSRKAKKIHRGNLNLYLLYIVVTVIGLLIWVTR